MTSSKIRWELKGCEGIRSSVDRRYFSYSSHIPERRCGKDRRCTNKKIFGSYINLQNEKSEVTDRGLILN